MNKPFKFSKSKKVLFEPKVGQLLGIYSLHKEERAPAETHLIHSYKHFLHKKLQIIIQRTFQKELLVNEFLVNAGLYDFNLREP